MLPGSISSPGVPVSPPMTPAGTSRQPEDVSAQCSGSRASHGDNEAWQCIHPGRGKVAVLGRATTGEQDGDGEESMPHQNSRKVSK